MQNTPNGGPVASKWAIGHALLRNDPSKWFRGTPIDDRDRALINASPVPWLNIGIQSFLKHVVRYNVKSARHQYVCCQKADCRPSTTCSGTSSSRPCAALQSTPKHHVCLLLTMFPDLLDR